MYEPAEKPNVLGSNVKVEEYDHDAAITPDDLSPIERPRGPDGKFLPSTPEPKPANPRHDDFTLDLARELDFPQTEIDSTDPSTFKAMVQAAYRRDRQLQANRQVMDEQTRTVRAVPPEEPLPSLEDAGFDPALIKHLNAKDKKIAQLEERLNAGEQTRRAESEEGTIDRVFEQLDAKTFGKGSGKEMLQKRDPALKKRIAVVREARADTGTGSLESKLRQAAKDLYGAPERGESVYDAPEKATDELTRRRQEWDDGVLERPTHRKEKALSPDKRAMAAVAKIQKEQEWGADEEDPELPE